MVALVYVSCCQCLCSGLSVYLCLCWLICLYLCVLHVCVVTIQSKASQEPSKQKSKFCKRMIVHPYFKVNSVLVRE